MSWQTYVDDHLMCEVEGHHLTAAAIMGQDGSVWAQSASFPQFKPEEFTNVMKDFNEPGSLAPVGLFIGSSKYMVIQGEPGVVIRGKKVTVLFLNMSLSCSMYRNTSLAFSYCDDILGMHSYSRSFFEVNLCIFLAGLMDAHDLLIVVILHVDGHMN
ncbi:hypothetical protein B296_00049835 [Ensete ventricosum]|uniref:Profilin n=1 Tax=Ensete ventricosum TaxID=4639 RepID=A0A426XT38_ENSVE|nr:hypothetical protein B296_00049835 [Ensete ventricosum]